MFKKLLFSCLLGLSCDTSHAMQSQTTPITYEGPQPTLDNKEIEINAKDEANFTAGWIVYNFEKSQQAEITLFEVEEEFRNNKQFRIGQALFQKCIDDALAHNCSKAIWTIHPTSNLDSKTLSIIYKKMINKLSNSSAYQLAEGEPYGPLSKIDMTLKLK